MKSVVAAAVLLSTASCSDDDTPKANVNASLDTGGELWIVQAKVYTADDMTGYAIPVDELSGEITSDQGIEQVGGGWVYSQPGKPDGSFLLTHGERGEAIRYTVTKDNDFVEGDTVSFENYGVQSGYGIVAWVDAHTAYWFDSAQLQVIRFDPTDMKIKDAYPIDGLERAGYRTWFSDRPAVRDDGVFITVNWSPTWEEGDVPDSPAGAKLVHIDPATDKITVTDDERCTSLLVSMTTPNGDTYFFSSYENAYVQIATAGKRGVPDCALRVRKGQSKFDPTWSLDLTERTGGRPADGILPGEGSTIWLRAFDGSKVDEQPTEYDGIDGAAAWQWYKLDLTSDAPAEENTQRPYSPHGTAGLLTQGRSFYMVPNEDYTESELLELKDDEFVKLATVVGELNTLIRVR